MRCPVRFTPPPSSWRPSTASRLPTRFDPSSPPGCRRGTLKQPAGASWGFDGARSWFRFRGERNSFDSIGETDGMFGVRGAHRLDQRLCDGPRLDAVESLAVRRRRQLCDGPNGINGLRDSTTFTAPRGIAYAGYAGRGWAVDGGVAVARAAYQTTRTVQFTRAGAGRRQRFSTVWIRRPRADRRELRRNCGAKCESTSGSDRGRFNPRPACAGRDRVERIDRDGCRCALAIRAGTIDQFGSG